MILQGELGLEEALKRWASNNNGSLTLGVSNDGGDGVNEV